MGSSIKGAILANHQQNVQAPIVEQKANVHADKALSLSKESPSAICRDLA
jgi:hypothetical protein